MNQAQDARPRSTGEGQSQRVVAVSLDGMGVADLPGEGRTA